MLRTGPIASVSLTSSGVSSIGDHTQTSPDDNHASAMRIGYGKPKNETAGPSATNSAFANSFSMTASFSCESRCA